MKQSINKKNIKHSCGNGCLEYHKESKLMNQLIRLSVCVVSFSLLTGCGWLWGEKGYFRNRSNDYLKAHQTPPLKIPENLKDNTLPFDTLYPIPNNIPNPTYSSYEVPRPVPLQIDANSNLPSLQTQAGSQWLIVQQPLASTYQQVLQYFQHAGFHIDITRPYTGEFTTTWIRPNGLSDGLSARLLAVDSSLNGQEIRVKVRIEPSVQDNSSEIFVLDMIRSEGSSATMDWPAKSNNALVESILLDELSANITNTVSDNIAVPLPEQNKLLVSLIRDSTNTPVLATAGSFDIISTQLEYAISSADIKVDDLDRSKGIYYINLAEKADGSAQNAGFFSGLFGDDSKEKVDARAERYIVQVKPVGNMMHISVTDINSMPVAANKAEAILKQLQKALMKT